MQYFPRTLFGVSLHWDLEATGQSGEVYEIGLSSLRGPGRMQYFPRRRPLLGFYCIKPMGPLES